MKPKRRYRGELPCDFFLLFFHKEFRPGVQTYPNRFIQLWKCFSLTKLCVIMTSAEKCSLVWENFERNLGGTFCELQENGELANVTLVCEDNHQLCWHPAAQY